MKLRLIIISAISIIILAGCSTTRKIPEGEVLYTGVDDLIINTVDSTDIDEAIEDKLVENIDVAPNGALVSPWMRHPFPVGLWIYNWEITPKTNGLKRWIYNKLAKEPVLISTVRPETRLKMMQQTMQNNGYFSATAKYSLKYDKKNEKRAEIIYTVNAGEPYLISSIDYNLPDSIGVSEAIDSLFRKRKLITPGSRYSIDSLLLARDKVTDFIRRKGYYFFRPEYIEYLADSTIEKNRIALRVQYAKDIPAKAMKEYRTRNITTTVHRYNGGGSPDTISTKRGNVIVMRPARLRKNLIPSCLTFKKGKIISTRDFSRTQSFLARLGIFRHISIDTTPLDSIKEDQDSIDIFINCVMDAPLEASIKFNGTYKSNSYLGPGAVLGLTHNNVFGGGEQLSLDLSASYEWQIGKQASGGSNNYYEFGINSTLAFPRLLAPKFIARTRRDINWTRISLGASIYNSPRLRYFQLNAALTYEWHTNRFSIHQLELPKLTFSKRIKENSTEISEDWGNDVVDLELVQPTEFIPKISYTYTFDRSFGKKKENNINLQLHIAEAGNIFSGIWSLAGDKSKEKQLFGVPFAQYVKLQAQLVYSQKIVPGHTLVARIMSGAGFVYGNSDMMPYGDDFYSGGPSSVRAFPIRGIGPGRFVGYNDWLTQYLRSGSFKFEMNLEYRFPILGIIKGAVFVDAGNVWLLKDPLNLYNGTATLKGSEFFNDLALGTGVGLRVDLDMLVVRADLGVGIHTPYDTGKSSYYNMPSFKKSLALNIAIGYPF